MFSDFGLAGKLVDRLISTQDRRQQQHDNNQQLAANQALQREFAQNGIRWKVEDAQRAGVHPLYALGASTHSFTPQAIGAPDTPATTFSDMGQDISRAMNATRTGGEKVDAYTQAMQKLTLEKGSLENDVLRQKLRSLVAAQQPNMPGTVPEADKFEDRPKLKAGADWGTHPQWVNAEDIEKRYGDVVQEIYGIGTLGADTWHNWENWAKSQTAAHGVNNRRKLDRYYNYLRR